MIDPANYIIMTHGDARRIADLLDYLSDMAEHAEDHLDDADERKELLEERLSARHWVKDFRDAMALQQYAPPSDR